MNVRIGITMACLLVGSAAMAGSNGDEDEIFDQAVKEFWPAPLIRDHV